MITRRFSTPLLAALIVGFLFTVALPILDEPTRWLLGQSTGRAPLVLWHHWTQAEMWATGAPVPSTGFPSLPLAPKVYSPAHHGLFAALSRVTGTGPTGAALAWNGAILSWLLIGAIGTVALIRRLIPKASAVSTGIGVVAIPISLGWSGAIVSGDVSDLPALALPAHLALLHRWVSTDRDMLSGLGAAALLAIAVLCRWEMSFFVMAMALPMAVVLGRHIQDRGEFVRWACVLAPGMLLGAMHIWGSDGQVIASVTTDTAPLRAPLSALVAADHLDQFAPWLLAMPTVGVLILAVLGSPQGALANAGWWLCALWGILLAGGTTATPFIAPGRRMSDLIPVLQGITDWSAVTPLVAIPLGILAAKGALALEKRHAGGIAIALALAAVVDQSHHVIGIHSTDQRFSIRPTQVTTIAYEGISEGAVLVLPLPLSDSRNRGESLLEQRIHRRPVSVGPTPQGGGVTALSYLARLALRMQTNPGSLPSPEVPLQPSEFLCATADIHNLIDLGFAAVSYRGLPDPGHPTWQSLRMVLGPPAFRDRTYTVWDLQQATQSHDAAPCDLPPVP